MSPNDGIPHGCISVDEAVALIKTGTRSDPVVDMDFLIRKTVWLEKNGPQHTFVIPLIRRLPQDKVYVTPRGNVHEYDSLGEKVAYIRTAFENELLKKTIYDRYRELTGHEYEAALVKARSTVADDAQGMNAVRPRANAKPIATAGAVIGEGSESTTNGMELSV